MSARWLVYETREDECAEPDWYLMDDVAEGWSFSPPYAVVVDNAIAFYLGRIDREMFSRLLDAAGIR